jgi:hypothetical protein
MPEAAIHNHTMPITISQVKKEACYRTVGSRRSAIALARCVTLLFNNKHINMAASVSIYRIEITDVNLRLDDTSIDVDDDELLTQEVIGEQSTIYVFELVDPRH